MASGERLLRLSTEAFSRLKNDHEQFLEAYEKPTQIYRFLHARHTLKSLFLHRNLSYMQHRRQRRKKRVRRIRLNDLLKYRKQRELEGKDLASEIKSDNFMKITFHDLEKGIDFSHLLSAALTGGIKSTPPICHAPSLMEVEVLLYNCHQHTSEATSCPFSSVSLGKFDIEYTPSPSTKNTKIVGSTSGDKHTLTIPESKFFWRGKNRGTGSLMLVFQARPRTDRPLVPSQKKSLHQSLGKVSVELNRMNHSDIAQLTKTRQAPSAQTDTCSARNLHDAGNNECDSRGSSASAGGGIAHVDTQTSSSETLLESTNEQAYSKAPRKTRSRVKDACIMTELCFGTGLATTYEHSTCKELGQVDSNDDRGSSASPPPPPLYPKKGFTENSASLLGRLAAQHNGLNGLNLFNGYREEDDHHSKKTTELCCNNKDSAFVESNFSLPVSIPRTTYRSSSLHSTSSSLCSEDASNDHTKGQRCHKVPARKRSEIQLLLDGDKPPGERISAEEVPVFTAEDPLDRETHHRHAAHQAPAKGGSWTRMGTGTRRITPVEQFVYPVLSTPAPLRKLGGRKRCLSESDTQQLTSEVDSPPPPKIARISAVEEEELSEECMNIGEEGEAEEAGMFSGTFRKHVKHDIDAKILSECTSPPPSSPPPNFSEDFTGEKNADAIEPAVPPPEGLFCAELVVFDSRGECLLDQGEYSILMQKCPQLQERGRPPPLVTFSPLSWSSVFGAGDQGEAEQSESMMLNFSLSWSQGPPKHRLMSEMETALDLQRIRNDYFAPAVVPRPPSTAAPAARVGTEPSSIADQQHNTPVTSPPSQPLQRASDNTRSHGSPGVSGSGREEERGKLVDVSSEEGGVAGEQNSAQKPIQGHENPEDGKGDLDDEYFTATEASAASSVADSTELAHCQLSTQPPTSATTLGRNSPAIGPPRDWNRIIYNFLYHNNSLQQTELCGDMCCPWCSVVCHRLYSLLKHMSLCHPRFLFTYTPLEEGSIIDVHVNKLYEAGQTSVDRDPVERSGMSLRQRWRGPLKCLPCTAIIVERPERVEEDLSEFLNDGSWKRGYNVKRQYYHSHTCLPMVPEEIDADSEAELESIGRWQRTCSQKMIDEFTDVNNGEKEMMKMWNLYAMEQGMTAYKQIPTACVQFTRDRGPEIIQKNIANNFRAHLISLCNFGLITPTDIKCCMDTLDTIRPLS